MYCESNEFYNICDFVNRYAFKFCVIVVNVFLNDVFLFVVLSV